MGLSCNPQNGKHLVWIEPDKLDSVRLDVNGPRMPCPGLGQARILTAKLTQLFRFPKVLLTFL